MAHKILVTGGAGFIGSHFVRYQIQNYPDAEVMNVDKLSYAADPARLKDVENSPRYRFVKADICDQEAMRPLIQEADYVVNFAAQTHVDNSIKEPIPFIESNTLGTFSLLQLARQAKHLKKYVQISTDEVYGPILEGAFKEDAPIRPSNPYSAAKASADALTFSYHVTYGIPAVITRTTNNYGPGQFPEKAIPVFVNKALRDQKIPIYGDGGHKRCWLHAQDHCSAIDLVMRQGKAGEIYHIAGDSECTNLEMANSILTILGKPASLISFIEDHDIRPGHDRRYALDDSKIRRELGWEPRITLEKGLKETVESYAGSLTTAEK